MKRLVSLFVAIGGVAALAGPALAQDRPQTPATTEAARLEMQADQAALDGDWATLTTLAGASYRASPSLANEFNLATAYVHNGQTALAVPLYADVAAHGQFAQGALLYDYRNPSAPVPVHKRVNYSDEANRRIAILTGGEVMKANNR
jgi:hypothetical protein